jgi:tRNA pseudouridine38/39 synthase
MQKSSASFSAFPEFHRSLHRLFCNNRSFHKLSRVPRRVQLRQLHPHRKGMAGYEAWTQAQLIARIRELEQQTGQNKILASNEKEQNAATASSPGVSSQSSEPISIPFRKPSKAPPKAFDASKYSTRLIALKFAYLGQKYNGFEHHKNNTTPLPTIEEEVWKALVKTRLINPIPTKGAETGYNRIDYKTFVKWDREGADVNWDGCDYSKCGRTDRGVSAFGQVIGVRVRSSRSLPRPASIHSEGGTDGQEGEEAAAIMDSEPASPAKPFNDLTDEMPYIQLLNRVLPPDIRVYAWCPNPPEDFSARFNCKERRYKYFFTNPCFAPVPSSAGIYNTTSSSPMREGHLDIAAMKAGCAALIGLHDFRNFCKIDASKQLTNFKRRIFHADIEEVAPLSVPAFLSHNAVSSPGGEGQPKTYAFVLHGSAFLWHQVRSIVAILFLIGQRLESPSIVPDLLDISTNPTRPKYEMASDAPLVLWDCIFPNPEEVQSSEERETGYEDRLQWIYVGDEGGVEPKSKGTAKGGGPSTAGRGKWGRGGVIDDVWEVWRGHKVDETLAALLLDKIAAHGQSTLDDDAFGEDAGVVGIAKSGPRVFDGGNVGRAKGNYIPVLKRERQEPVEVVNERYAKRKGLDPNRFKKAEDDGDE